MRRDEVIEKLQAHADEYLADLFGRKVDFTTRSGLHPELRGRIESSAARVL